MNFGRRPSRSSSVSRSSSRSIRMPSAVDLDLDDVGLVRGEGRHGARVGRRLGDDHVAGIDQRLRDEVDHLLAARRDDQVVGVDLHPAVGVHDLGDAVLGLGEPLGRAVLERLRARLVRDPLRDGRERLRREAAGVGQPARERDHLRPRGHGHQVAHRRRLHDLRPRGEEAGVSLEVAPGRARPAAARSVVYSHRPSGYRAPHRYLASFSTSARAPASPRRAASARSSRRSWRARSGARTSASTSPAATSPSSSRSRSSR